MSATTPLRGTQVTYFVELPKGANQPIVHVKEDWRPGKYLVHFTLLSLGAIGIAFTISPSSPNDSNGMTRSTALVFDCIVGGTYALWWCCNNFCKRN